MPQRVSPTDSPSADCVGSLVLRILLGGLICWRLMLPPESSILGETLWVTQATLGAAAAWACLQFFRNRNFVRFDRWDALVWLTIAGHVISTVLLWTWGGDQRAGLNLCWEWVALGALFLLLRPSIRTREEAGNLVRLLIAIGVCFACFGVWQKYYEHGQLLREYTELREGYSELQRLSASGPMSSALAEELRKIELEFSRSNIPLDGPGRMMFQSRLEFGSEPTGRWALANSLGGFLATGLVLCCAFVVPLGKSAGRVLRLVPVAGALGFTLFLTHSRTAGVALVIAILGVILDNWNIPPDQRRRILKLVIGGGLLAAVGAGACLVSIDATNLDGNVVTRSLKTRIQYWIATTDMLSERPVFGTGPGNFRQHYLAYKLPESSEEIQDPHNFVLDLWAGGGLVAVIAWLALLGLLGREWCRRFLAPDEFLPRNGSPPVGSNSAGSNARRSGSTTPAPAQLPGFVIGAIVALAILFGHSVLRDHEIAWELPAFALAIPVIFWFLPDDLVSERSLKSAALWGIVTLSIHLLGAGGIEMPGVVAILLILIAVTIEPQSVSRTSPRSEWLQSLGIGVLGIALSWACFQTATSPVSARNALIDEAYYRMSETGDVANARRLFREAANRDRWAAEPWRQLAELELSAWRGDLRDNSAFERAVEALDQAKIRDPWSGRDARFLGEMFMLRFDVTKDPDWGRRALEEFEFADARIPHNERILLQTTFLAEALNFPEKAAAAAKKAIEIDRISRKNGHWEKLLSEDELERLGRIAESP